MSLLLSLPNELKELILSFVEKDEDLVNFALAGPTGRDLIYDPTTSIWREHWALNYDLPSGMTGIQARVLYQDRQNTLGNIPEFTFGRGLLEKRCLEVIRDLITESFVNVSPDAMNKPVSMNLIHLRYLTKRTNIVQTFYSWRNQRGFNPLLQTIQLLMTPWTLEYRLYYKVEGFPISQHIAYGNPARYPMFLDQHQTKINIKLLLHIMNFFTHHLTSVEEFTLYDAFQDLWPGNKPQAWEAPLEPGTKAMGESWMGMDAHLRLHREYHQVRNTRPGDNTFTDIIGADDRDFGFLDLNFTPADKPHWPEAYDYLDSYPSSVATPTTNTDCIQFTGIGYDLEFFNCSGVIHAIAPQHGIPGWQRITMMKKLVSDDARPSSPDTQSVDASGKGFTIFSEGDAEDRLIDDRCYAYEGIVLPGGMIMIGRWWCPMDPIGQMLVTGPWIQWRTTDLAQFEMD